MSRDRMGPVADHEAVGPDLPLGDRVDDQPDEEAERKRMREAHAGPRAVELSGVVGLEQPDLEDVDAVHETLREHVRRVGADQKRHEGDASPEVLLDDVGLEVVRGPAHRRRRR